MGETADNRAAFQLLRRWAFFCVLDDLREIFLFSDSARNVMAARIAHRTSVVDAILITGIWWYEAVGGHEDGTVKCFKFFFLFPPGSTVVAIEMMVFLECRIRVGRKHFGVGINVDATVF